MTSAIVRIATWLAISLGCLVLPGCSGDWMAIAQYSLVGMVHKGPYAKGANVRVLGYRKFGEAPATDTVVSTTSDLGEYQASLQLPFAVLLADGTYFNELTGKPADRPLQLQALAALSGGESQTVHINLVTHVTTLRALSLISGGQDPVIAQAQAENELRVALGLTWPAGIQLRGRELSLVAPDLDRRAYLWAVTMRYLQVVQSLAMQSGGSSAQAMQYLLEQTSVGLMSTGKFYAPEATLFEKARSAGWPGALIASLSARLAALGAASNVPELGRAQDSDGDGVNDAVDTCVRVANPDQAVRPPEICDFQVQEQVMAGYSALPNWVVLDGVDRNGRGRVMFLSRAGAGDWMAAADGQGSFSPFQALTLPSGGPSLKDLVARAQAIPDVDGDGATDVLAASTVGLVPEGIYGTGGGASLSNFVQTTPLPLPVLDGMNFHGISAQLSSIAVADFDKNGWMDLAGVHLNSAGSYRIVLQLQSAAGTWAMPTLAMTAGLSLARTLTAGDLNADGNPDLVVTGSFGALVLLGDGTGSFTAQPTVNACAGSSGCPHTAALADFDHDGTQDLLVMASSSGALAQPHFVGVLRGNGQGQLAHVAALVSLSPTTLPGSMRRLDANGDGWVDLLVSDGKTLQLCMNIGGRLASPQSLPSGLSSSVSDGSLFGVRDLNRDGRDDLLFVAPAIPFGGTGVATVKLVSVLLH